MDHLQKLENNTIFIIREAYRQFKNVSMLWSIGKDSTALLWLIRKSFYGRIPFPVMHLDTGYKFKEIYEFRDRYAKKWGLNLLVYKNQEAIDRGVSPSKGKFECCTELKTNALKKAISQHKFRALYLGIRRDEHGIRAKERTFCFPQGSLVYGENIKPIESVKEGDLVYTHLSSLKRVKGVSSREYRGKLLSITSRYNRAIFMTPNHVLLAKVRGVPKKIVEVVAKGFDGKIRKIDLPIEGRRRIVWVQASELKAGDRLWVPKLAKKPQERHNSPEFIPIDKIIGECPGFIRNKKKLYWKSAHKSSCKIRRSLPITSEMMRVIGYYIAEGSANPSSNQFEFGFGSHEENLANDVVKVINNYFGIKGITERRNSSIRVQYSSKTLMLIFQYLCGKGASNKKLPYFFTRLTNRQLCELVKGCWLGDGSKERYSTVSKLLAHQLRTAMLRLGILTSLKKCIDGRFSLTIAGLSKTRFQNLFGFECEVPYVGRFRDVKEVNGLHSTSLSHSNYGKSRCGGFWVPIDRIELVDYNGPVYDLSIEGDSSYLVQGVTVHNSPRDEDFEWNYREQPPELWDLYKTKAKEEEHLRIHPLLGWTELDVWQYIKRENIPIVSLYFAKDGRRYRSIGCETCCNPICSNADTIERIIEELKTTRISERSGRAQDKESPYMMQKLRSLGYM